MRLFKWFAERQNEKKRQIDIKILWPTILENAPSVMRAKAAFAAHAYRDHAWVVLGDDEIRRRIDALPTILQIGERDEADT